MVRALLVALLFSPLSVFASVVVVDVAYDVPGTDTKREWVEFFTDTAIDDIRKWRFLEGGVRHRIAGESGMVPANTRFVLAADIPSFRADNPEYTGLVFDTAMSLSNSGETFSLLTASGTAVAHTYTPVPKPVAEKPVSSTKQGAPKKEPRVLGAATTATPTLIERGQLVAAAIEAPSREFAWVSFAVLAVFVVAGVGALFFLSRQQ